MPGVLYIVATPIGNLDDISLRAIATLQAVDLIAAEDTRHSKFLLDHLGIEKRMISCHEHNEEARCGLILQTLESGADVALISDAGTPLISDPGYRLVNTVREAGIRVTPIPGAHSVITALCASGLATVTGGAWRAWSGASPPQEAAPRAARTPTIISAARRPRSRSIFSCLIG